jgi:hypothetical protein
MAATPTGAGRAASWRPVAGWQAAALAAACLLLWASTWTRGWIFAVVSGADLVFHEAGHPIFGIFGWPLLAFLGGALGQLAFPASAAAVFAVRRLAPSFAAMVLWLGFNLLDIGRYAADGDARALPLLAPDPGSHDWWNILGILGLRGRAGLVGGALQALGWAVMAAAPAWLAWRWRRGARPEEAAPAHPW